MFLTHVPIQSSKSFSRWLEFFAVLCGGKRDCFARVFGKIQPQAIVIVYVSLILQFSERFLAHRSAAVLRLHAFHLGANQTRWSELDLRWEALPPSEASGVDRSIGTAGWSIRSGRLTKCDACELDWRLITWLKYNRIINDMLAIYNSATICGYEQPFHCSLRLQPQLREVR